MLDKLPPQARHLLLCFVAAFLTFVVNAVIASQGVTGLDVNVLVDAFNAAAVATASVGLALYLTPLTKQYGVGSK